MYSDPPVPLHRSLLALTPIQVRQVYMSALLEAKEVLLDQYTAQTQELVAFKREHEEERLSPPKYVHDKAPTSILPNIPSPAATDIALVTQVASSDINQEPEEIKWPVRPPYSYHVNPADQIPGQHIPSPHR